MRRTRRPPLVSDFDPEDETLNATRDYFDLLGAGYIGKHTREGWRSFRAGYLAQAAMYAEPESPASRRGTRR
jgi:hypothetical protein